MVAMRTLLIGLLLRPFLLATEIPTLRFEDRLTWKQVFDFGFRPKHLEGLERNTCVCLNQSFWVQFKDRDLRFKVENGRVSFSFLYDDFLSMVWHQGGEAITLDEGKRRADEFRKVFDGYIIQEMSMPRLIDPSGLVDAGNDENDIKARVGEYLILYGFDNSMGKVKPIIPHFYIAWNFPGMPDSRSKDSGDVVRPPKGYEWYSLDPKVNTPDPGSPSSDSPDTSPSIPTKEELVVPRDETKHKSLANLKVVTENTRWNWWLGLFVICLVGVVAAVRKIKFRRRKSR